MAGFSLLASVFCEVAAHADEQGLSTKLTFSEPIPR